MTPKPRPAALLRSERLALGLAFPAASGDAPLLSGDELRQLERLRLVHLDAVLSGLVGQPVGAAGARGLEFVEYRPYTPGDDLRRIDANVYARLHQAFVKTSPAERDIGLSLLLDGSRSIGLPGSPPRRHGDRLAALLGAIALLRGDSTQVAVLADGEAWGGAPLTGPQMIPSLLDELERLPRGMRTDLAGAIRAHRRLQAPVEIAALITDALVEPAALEEAVAELAGTARAAVVLHVVEAVPEALAGAPGAVELRDRETGERMVVDVTPRVRAAYAERASELAGRVEAVCAANGAAYARTPVEGDPLVQVVAFAREGEMLERAR
jgi:uncharacterized protein (DUF58 family)